MSAPVPKPHTWKSVCKSRRQYRVCRRLSLLERNCLPSQYTALVACLEVRPLHWGRCIQGLKRARLVKVRPTFLDPSRHPAIAPIALPRRTSMCKLEMYRGDNGGETYPARHAIVRCVAKSQACTVFFLAVTRTRPHFCLRLGRRVGVRAYWEKSAAAHASHAEGGAIAFKVHSSLGTDTPRGHRPAQVPHIAVVVTSNASTACTSVAGIQAYTRRMPHDSSLTRTQHIAMLCMPAHQPRAHASRGQSTHTGASIVL
ncbi:hypothetical protein C8R47DRAFT_556647 [Mycena vitilis]|nr:hypothetical protein C8R47DRAFT_556647 [Mycena vitilis]